MLIGYFGDGPWSHKALKKIMSDPNNKVSFVCTRFKNSDMKLESIAALNKIPFFSVRSINTKASLDFLKGFNF